MEEEKEGETEKEKEKLKEGEEGNKAVWTNEKKCPVTNGCCGSDQMVNPCASLLDQ